jgi:hypothetical protein
MFRHIRVITMLAALLLAFVFSVGSTGRASAQTSAGCDTTGTVNGTATPTYGTAGTTVQFRVTGFRQGEDVSYWFTLPSGDVLGTAAAVPLPVNADGSIGPLPFTISQGLVDLAPGRWAVTFQGSASGNTAVVYFCILTAAQATQVAQPATATAVPPTAIPATATSVPATATTVATTAPAVSPTVAAVDTAVPATATTVSVPPTEVATAVVVPTEVLPVPTVDMGTGALPGMPTTGQSDSPMLVTLLLAALGLLGIGVLARRTKSAGR